VFIFQPGRVKKRYGVRRLDAVLDRLSSGLTRKPASLQGDGALLAPPLTTETGT